MRKSQVKTSFHAAPHIATKQIISPLVDSAEVTEILLIAGVKMSNEINRVLRAPVYVNQKSSGGQEWIQGIFNLGRKPTNVGK